MPILSIKDLHLEFNTSRGVQKILRGVNLNIDKGEFFCLIGQSGSGKSMLAKAIMQLLYPESRLTKGTIYFNGEEIHNKNSEEMRLIRGKEIGMIFQDPVRSLNPTMKIGLQIDEVFRIHHHIKARLAKTRTLEFLRLVGIADPINRYHAYPFELSGGMCQRVMIAMTLAAEPKLLIADEPTTGLDVTVQGQILDLLETLQNELKMTILLITHDLGVIARSCTHVGVMKEGVIVETAPVEQLFYAPVHPYTQELLASRPGCL
jgi:ABC-type dipeptide/oligopeptide/nickel transport system ATPase component